MAALSGRDDRGRKGRALKGGRASRACLALSSLGMSLALLAQPAGAQSMRFFGHGTHDVDRVKIRADSSSIPANIGATDITIEFWLVATSENTAPAVAPGAGVFSWIDGNIVLDKDRFSQNGKWGVSLTDGRVTFGVNNSSGTQETWRGTTDLRGPPGQWHHVAIQRAFASGAVQIYVDGVREVNDSAGPTGDISYPDGGVPSSTLCTAGGGPCTYSDPFLVIGAEKHNVDAQRYPAFRGWLTELRLSRSLRYSGATVAAPTAIFAVDSSTAALYHFDEGQSSAVNDAVGASPGVVFFGGTAPAGPQWSSDSPFTGTPDTIRFSSASYSVAENGGTLAVAAIRSQGTGAASVELSVTGGTAGEGADFSLPAQRLISWQAGENGTKTLSLSITDDALNEGAETIALALTNVSGGALVQPSAATVTIDDDESAPVTVQFASASQAVSEGTATLQLSVTRMGDASAPASVEIAIASGGTAGEGADFTLPIARTLSWASGESGPKTLAVTIVDDSGVEGSETVSFELRNASGASLGAVATTTLTLNDNDAAAPGGGSGRSAGGGGGAIDALIAPLMTVLALMRALRDLRVRLRPCSFVTYPTESIDPVV